MEEQSTTGLTERQITQFIQDHQIGMHEPVGNAALISCLFFLFQLVNQFNGG